MLTFFCAAAYISSYVPQSESTQTNFVIKRFELCNHSQGIIKFYGNITTENYNNQYISYNVSVPFDLDEKIGSICDIYPKTVGTHFTKLFSIREKNFCKATNKYMGEFWYELERASQITPRTCPIRAGRYNVHHTYLDFRKISLQTFPFGGLRFIWKVVNNKDANLKLICLLIEVENYIN